MANSLNNQTVNFSSSSININNQMAYNNYDVPLKVNLIKRVMEKCNINFAIIYYSIFYQLKYIKD